MIRLFRLGRKSPGIIVDRLRKQGVRTSLVWVYARGVPLITGVPIIKYSQITPQIYIGPQYRRRGKRKLMQCGITNSVNLRIEFDDRERGLDLESYCYLPVVDDAAPTLDQLQEGVDFISRAVNNGGKVYIHCAGGVGRAPTMAAAYFISTGMSLESAINLVRRNRPFIRLMPPQVAQLRRFEDAQAALK
jgi:predicted protein tyrosine phosphatase